MKKFLYILPILFSTLFTSCSQPGVIDEWKVWIALKYVNYSIEGNMISSEIVSEYIDQRLDDNINLTLAGDYSDDPTGGAEWAEYQIYYEVAKDLLKGYWHSYNPYISISENMEYLFSCINNGFGYTILLEKAGYDHEVAEYYADLILNNEYTIHNLTKIYADIEETLFPIYEDMVSIEEYWWVEEWSGKTCDAYQVIYNINNYYILATIIEKTDHSSEIEIVAYADSLKELDELTE